MSRQKWTPEETTELSNRWAHSTKAELMEAFSGRSWPALENKAKRLKLGRRDEFQAKSASAESEFRAIKNKIRSGWVPKGREARELAEMMESLGYSLNREAPKKFDWTPTDIYSGRWDGEEGAFGLISCTHYGSIWQQQTALDAYYDRLLEESIDTVLHAGDVTDGDDSMHKGFLYGLHQHGADQQRDYTVRRYPRRPGIHTYAISGNHDLTFAKAAGFNVVRAICAQREDMTYLSDWGADLVLDGGLRVHIGHGSGGGAYAKSYKIQKAIDGLDVRKELPHIYAMGHWHNPCHFEDRGIQAIQLGSFQGTTDYIKSKPQLGDSCVGGYIVRYRMKDDELVSLVLEWLPFKELAHDYPA